MTTYICPLQPVRRPRRAWRPPSLRQLLGGPVAAGLLFGVSFGAGLVLPLLLVR